MRLSRRSALGAIAAAPSGIKQLSQRIAAAETAATAAAANLAPVASEMPVGAGLWQIAHDPRLMVLYQSGLLPDWARTDVEEQARMHGYGLHTDISALRSVSLSAKRLINDRRRIARAWVEAPSFFARQLARKSFAGQDDGVKKPMPPYVVG